MFLAENALGGDEGPSAYARFFDISLVGGDDPSLRYQPAEGSTVDVTIELADAESENLRVIHFADGAELPELLADVSVGTGGDGEGLVLSFAAGGFSVYAIVDAPEPAVPSCWGKAASVEEIAELGGSGLYLRSPGGFYFTNVQYDISTTRTGIKKVKPKASSPDLAAGAVLCYFEQVGETGNRFKVYCFSDQDEKTYVRQSGSSLSLVTEAEASVFTIDVFPITWKRRRPPTAIRSCPGICASPSAKTEK